VCRLEDCTEEAAGRTFRRAFELCGGPLWPEPGSPLAWTIYWCALSLHGPPRLHPQAARLAARFMLGSEVEQQVVRRTVLAWRGLEPAREWEGAAGLEWCVRPSAEEAARRLGGVGVMGPPPPRAADEGQWFGLPGCLNENNAAARLMLLFQALEGSFADSAFAFDYTQPEFLVAGRAADVWFVAD
jgi:hypothetical protein